MTRGLILLPIAVCLLVSCGGESEYSSPEDRGGGPKGVTGILLNLQQPADVDSAKRWPKWRVVGPSGSVLFTSDDCPKNVLGPAVEFKRANALSEGHLKGKDAKLGRNYREIKIAKAEADESSKTATFHLDAGGVSQLEAIPNYRALLGDGKMVMLFGTEGN